MHVTFYRIEDVTYEKFDKLDILLPEEFENYKQKLSEEGREVKVLYNTNLKTFNSKKSESIYLIVDYVLYPLNPENKCLAEGYVSISEDEFIRIEKVQNTTPSYLLWIYAIITAVCFMVVLLHLTGVLNIFNKGFDDGKDGKITFNKGSGKSITVDQSEIEWNGEKPVTETREKMESITIPGFHKFTANSSRTDVPLYNPQDNTVYLKYTIYNIIGSEVVGEYSSYEEANSFIKEYFKEYTLDANTLQYYDSENDTYLDYIDKYEVKTDEDKFIVEKETISVVHCTDAISPGKQVLWNAYESLGPGEYNLRFNIETFDIETGAACSGARPMVKAIIEE